jgi:hypothetical protein
MYRNPHIHAGSEHYQEQKWAILLIVICHVRSTCDADGTDEEIRYPNQTLRENYTATRTSDMACIPKLNCRLRMKKTY